MWGGDPSWPKSKYRSCFVHATLLGRAYALSHIPSQDDPTKTLGYEIDALWKIIHDIIIEGLFTFEPEIGARYAVGIFILTCSKEMEGTRGFDGMKGKGKNRIWYGPGFADPDTEWGWKEVRAAVKGQRIYRGIRRGRSGRRRRFGDGRLWSIFRQRWWRCWIRRGAI